MEMRSIFRVHSGAVIAAPKTLTIQNVALLARLVWILPKTVTWGEDAG